MVVIVGICGFARSRRDVYSALDAVELQETFYNLPNEERLRALSREAPPGFVFTVKVFQGITHPPTSPTFKRTRGFRPTENHGLLKPTSENLELWDLFRRLTKPLGARVYVFQTPPSMRTEHLSAALEFFRTIRGDETIAWEPRGEVANVEGLDAALAEINVSLVVDPLKRPLPNSPIHYFRLHGMGGEVNYRYKYTDDDLNKLLIISKKAKNPYIMFNNIYMFDDAVRFKRLASAIS
ncbi:DUF72 domain-containing protein [Thermoproteus tenax]|uniref:DUF72 domain-containing protein n=1 Tax=Thermoproteus tenax TaxID=2271 RepID=UPI00069A26F4|nr:DUF72 domain-containing protein [Thermoproteus tenax]